MWTDRSKLVLTAFGLWVIWTLATWVFEGRVEALLRPDALVDRLLYIGVANIGIGIVGAAVLVGRMVRRSQMQRDRLGFGSPVRTLIWVPVGVALGFALYFGQGAPSKDPIVIINIYAQVLVVSIAEVLVCWAVVAGVLAQATTLAKWVSIPLAAIVASALFGLYHFAHSPPFNTLEMVSLLAVVGLMTSAFFFLSRDVYATAVFHNFLAVFGVVQALAANDKLTTYQTLQVPLFGMSLAAIIILVLADIFLIRRKTV